MTLKKEEKVIGNHTYTVTALGALKGREVFVLLVKLMGGAADGLEAKNLGEALLTLTKNLETKDFNYLCETFAKATDVEIEGRNPKLSDVFDLHFSANYLEMTEWLVFCLVVNFESFFRGLAAKLAKGASATPLAKVSSPSA